MSELRIRRNTRRGRPAWPARAALLVAVALLAGACTSTRTPVTRTPAPLGTVTAVPQPTQGVSPPGTPAGAQLRWLVTAVTHLPLSDAQVRAHFDPSFLAEVGQAGLN